MLVEQRAAVPRNAATPQPHRPPPARAAMIYNGNASTARPTLQKVTDRFASLPPSRRDEIQRHLRMLLNGAIQDCLDGVDEQRIVTERMRVNRPERAWKFFQPDPAAPRKFVQAPTPSGSC